MIFVTVGTHEQPFDRLIRCVDELRKNGTITEEVIIQTGFATYEPKYCTWNRMFSYEEMVRNVKAARIVITHGGPASFIMSLQIGKIPIVVPRQKKYGEHVNNHQVEFTRAVAERMGNIIVVEDTAVLGNVIGGYDVYCGKLGKVHGEMEGNFERTGSPFGGIGNNRGFNERLEEIVRGLWEIK